MPSTNDSDRMTPPSRSMTRRCPSSWRVSSRCAPPTSSPASVPRRQTAPPCSSPHGPARRRHTGTVDAGAHAATARAVPVNTLLRAHAAALQQLLPCTTPHKHTYDGVHASRQLTVVPQRRLRPGAGTWIPARSWPAPSAPRGSLPPGHLAQGGVELDGTSLGCQAAVRGTGRPVHRVHMQQLAIRTPDCNLGTGCPCGGQTVRLIAASPGPAVPARARCQCRHIEAQAVLSR